MPPDFGTGVVVTVTKQLCSSYPAPVTDKSAELTGFDNLENLVRGVFTSLEETKKKNERKKEPQQQRAQRSRILKLHTYTTPFTFLLFFLPKKWEYVSVVFF